jgi:hypothetical protein
MFLSGIILYIAPEGSLSRWIDWDILNLSKKQWEHQHTIFSYLFILFTIFHIFKINWSLLLSYFVPEKIKISHYKELLIASAITILIFIGTLFNATPLKYIIDLGADISHRVSENVEIPDVSDSEKLSIEVFSIEILNTSFENVNKILNDNSLSGSREDILVKDFCSINNISPHEFYRLLKGELLIRNSSNVMGFPDITSKINCLDQINSIL